MGLYETIDLLALLPLPSAPYEFAEWKMCKLGIDYHVEFDDHHYSAPYTLFKKELWMRSSDKVVEIFYRGDRVASHLRSFIKWKHTTHPDHMPSTHRAYAEWTPDRVIRWAYSIGPSTRDVTEKIMESKDHPEQGFKACTGILSLAKNYGPERLEKACIRALRLHTVNYRSIKAILQHKMESAEHLNEEQAIEQPAPQVPSSSPCENVRGGSYYH
jgi:transposase